MTWNKRIAIIKQLGSFVFLIGIACLAAVVFGNEAQQAQAVVVRSIMIDPGHGGADPGAVSCLGYYEKDLNLSVANRLATQLKSAGWVVFMTRSVDMDVSLSERVALANVDAPDLFLSIHGDSWTDPVAKGCTLFVAPKASDKSREVAKAISSAMPVQHNRGVKEANFRVLAKTRCPAVLLEMGFLSNIDDASMLKSTDWQYSLVDSLVKALEVL